MICDHFGRILSCSPGGFFDSMNDKAIVRFDGTISQLKAGSHDHVEFELLKGIGEKDTIKIKGVYVIVDGGYHQWRVTMSASRLDPDSDIIAWRKQMESVRKDNEDVFGLLKGRFRI